jgi:hypothetical protein
MANQVVGIQNSGDRDVDEVKFCAKQQLGLGVQVN